MKSNGATNVYTFNDAGLPSTCGVNPLQAAIGCLNHCHSQSRPHRCRVWRWFAWRVWRRYHSQRCSSFLCDILRHLGGARSRSRLGWRSNFRNGGWIRLWLLVKPLIMRLVFTQFVVIPEWLASMPETTPMHLSKRFCTTLCHLYSNNG